MKRRWMVRCAAATVGLTAAGSALALSGGLVGAGASVGAVPTKNVAISATCTATIYCFTPANVAIASGGTVTWKNTTVAPHSVSRCSTAACGVSGGTGTDTGFGSGFLSNLQTYSFTFHKTGTYTYYCMVHGYAVMHGTITVDALPTIGSVAPQSVAHGHANVALTVTGTGFLAGAKAKVSGTGVTVVSTVRTDAKHLKVTVTVAATATRGGRSITVTNTDGGSVTKTAALTIT